MAIALGPNRYGKSRIRLLRVVRDSVPHAIYDWTVQVLLRGEFGRAYTEGDNRQLLTTDAMKNTVYSLARSSSARTMEGFATELVQFLISRDPTLQSAEVTIESALWKRLTVGGAPHPSAFMHGSDERQTAVVEQHQNNAVIVTAGFTNLVLLKTANSGFKGFRRDDLTTLPETDDRLLGTSMRASWSYREAGIDFDGERSGIREAMLRTFADHRSRSVQETLFAMGEAALQASAAIDAIDLDMPNRHALLIDLSRFGQDNPNQIFVPTDEPHGSIQARIQRGAPA